MAAMAAKAAALGLRQMVFTDHEDYQADGSPFPHQMSFDKYIAEFGRVKRQYADRVELLLGVEFGLAPRINHKLESLAARYPLEFIIGSSHDIEAKDLYNGEFFLGRDIHAAHRAYFEEVLQNVRTTDAYDVYGHIDYIVRYGGYQPNELRYSDHADIIDEILRELIARGKGLELNTSGYRYGLNCTHPQPDILKRYRQLGGEIITIGSDAHRALDICANFEEARLLLLQTGFKAYTLFRNRRPYWADLES
jgi:histidinol-phosphatase (PHP family)